MVSRGKGDGGGQNNEGFQKGKTFHYIINNSWGCKNMVSIVNNAILHIQKLLREQILKLITRKKIATMVTDNYDHFTV